MNAVINEPKGLFTSYVEEKMTQTMEFDEFARNICSEAGRVLGEDYQVEVREIRKNNGVVLKGLVITPETGGLQNVVPTIYLDDLFKAYRSGRTFGTVTEMLLEAYRKNTPKEPVDMEFFRSFEKVRGRICFRLVGRAGNERLLEDVPHKEFLDLAVCFYYAYQGEPLGEGTILIHNSYMEMWGTCTEELYALALENTPRLFSWECRSMEELIKDMTGLTPSGEEDELRTSPHGGLSMRVLTNKRKFYGAACMLYPGLLEKIALEGRRNLYILPSSLHEVILLEDTGMENEEELKEMIASVNSTVVGHEEVLSNSLYYYNIEEKTVKIA